MQEALTALPCVEPSSIKVDVTKQEARFMVKDKSKCSMQEVSKAIEDVGFSVADAKLKS